MSFNSFRKIFYIFLQLLFFPLLKNIHMKSSLASVTFAATLVLQASQLVAASPIFKFPEAHYNDASVQDICQGKQQRHRIPS